jgi:hypothetical protein
MVLDGLPGSLALEVISDVRTIIHEEHVEGIKGKFRNFEKIWKFLKFQIDWKNSLGIFEEGYEILFQEIQRPCCNPIWSH